MKRRPKRGFGEDGFESRGGYMAAKKEKLKEQFTLTAAKEVGDGPEEKTNGIFHGVAIYVNGFTSPSADELKRIMMIHGGMYHHYLGQNTTHIVATNLPNVKIMKLKVMKVVKPEWIVDSVQAKKLLDFRTYLLYSHQSVTQPRLHFSDSSKTASDDNLLIASTKSVPQETSSLRDESIEVHATLPYIQPSVPSADEGKEKNVGESSNRSNDSNQISEINIRQKTNHEISGGSGSGPIFTDAASERPASKSSSWNARSAGDAGFLSEFYNNSRLHHLSTMGATFKQYVNELRDRSDNAFPGRDELKNCLLEKKRSIHETYADRDEIDDKNEDEGNAKDDLVKKVIMHIDMDCFFVSVGLRRRPELRGLPVAVTHSKAGRPGPNRQPGTSRQAEFDMYKQRQNVRDLKKNGSTDMVATRVDEVDDTMSLSEIASCSYEARAAGVKNGMFMGPALKLCPGLRTIPYDFQAYKQVSYALYDTVARYTLDIEAVSCDELFVDCTKLLRESEADPLEFASFIRGEIKDKTGCPASAGFGSNMLQARLATREAKPDGQFSLEPDRAQQFMANVQLQHLPGIGRSLSRRLRGLSMESCGDLQQLSLARLQQEFGVKTGQTLFRHCRGHDDRSLCVQHVRKSVSAEVNYGIRFAQQAEADEFVRQLATEVSGRLKEIAMKGRCITLKLMVRAKDAPVETAKFMGHGVCDHIAKSATLLQAVADADAITREVLAITRHLAIQPGELRGVGIQVSRLESDSKATVGGIQNFLTKSTSRYPSEKVSATTSSRPQEASLHDSTVPPGIDAGTLAELPEDIRREVLQEYRARKPEVDCVAGPSRQSDIGAQSENHGDDDAVQPTKEASNDAWDLNYSQIDTSFLEALPRDLQQELKTKLSRQKQEEPKWSKKQTRKIRIVEEEPKGPYDDLTLQEMRSLIKEWVRSEHEPQAYDIQMLTEHFQRLARTHRLDTLDLLIKCLHRCVVAKKSGVWEQAFHSIVEKTQETMIRFFRHQLLISTQFPVGRSLPLSEIVKEH